MLKMIVSVGDIIKIHKLTATNTCLHHTVLFIISLPPLTPSLPPSHSPPPSLPLSPSPPLPLPPYPPPSLSGEGYSFQLVIYDRNRKILKDLIKMTEIVTIRSCCDCYFQVFLASGKILQLRAGTMELQAHWMAMLKVGLGRGMLEW